MTKPLTDNMWAMLELAEQYTGGDFAGVCALDSTQAVGLAALSRRGLVKYVSHGSHEDDPEGKERAIFAITGAGKALLEDRP